MVIFGHSLASVPGVYGYKMYQIYRMRRAGEGFFIKTTQNTIFNIPLVRGWLALELDRGSQIAPAKNPASRRGPFLQNLQKYTFGGLGTPVLKRAPGFNPYWNGLLDTRFWAILGCFDPF